ncbi:MAG: phytoene synthase [Patescibacteria group bacterium]|nr:MAG: phytoene synthase [Patescibacteria group bacterium]
MGRNLETHYIVCEAITKRASSTFYLGSSIFPKRERKYVWAIYAFCRHADDLVDESGLTKAEIEKRLDFLREIIEYVRDDKWQGDFYSDEIKSISVALRDTFRKHEFLTKGPFLRLIEGVAIDLDKKDFASIIELTDYCDKVAGGVGQIICELLGINDSQSVADARKMGNAMQLTNILRDIGEDQARGRVYIPHEKLVEYQIGLPLENSPQLKNLVASLVELTHIDYRNARKSLKIFPLRVRMALNTASFLYEGILDDISANGYQVLDRRAHVSGTKKVIIVFKSLLASLF